MHSIAFVRSTMASADLLSYRDRMDAKRPGWIASSSSCQGVSVSCEAVAAISLDCRLMSVRTSLAIEA